MDIIENLLYPILLSENKKFYCNAIEGKTIEISSEGDILRCGCIRIPEMILGNIFEKSLVDIYSEAEKKKRFNQMDVDSISECKDCEYKYICVGGCRAVAYHNTGLYGKSPYCEDYKKIIKIFVRDLNNGALDDYRKFLKMRLPHKKLF